MNKKSPIIEAAQAPENYKFNNFTSPEQPMPPEISAKLEKARKYDRMMLLLEASEKHYEHMISLTKSYMNKEMENPIDFYNKGTLFGYEDVLGDIRILMDSDHA